LSCLSREVAAPSKEPLGAGGTPLPCKDLPTAVESFRRCGAEALSAAGDRSRDDLWGSACDLVSAVLLGIQDHLPELRPEIDLREGGSTGSTELVSITVRFGDAPIVGEVATLSRCCFEVRITGPLRFALRQPSAASCGGCKQPLVLAASGFDLPNLRDVAEMRSQLASLLGRGFDREAAYEWWQSNKDKEYPLETSKFHRMFESLFGQKATQLLPAQIRVDALWGYLHNPGCSIQTFTFHKDHKARGITVTATRAAPRTTEEAALVETCRQISHTVLRENRSAGERFATSTTSFCAMLYGHEVEQAGARAATIIKLFSAAKWWGPGDDGWHRWDQTWTCKDKRNKLGMLTEENGRIVWRIGKVDGDSVVLAGKSGDARTCQRRGPTCCCRRRR